jgi:hypothetical protein
MSRSLLWASLTAALTSAAAWFLSRSAIFAAVVGTLFGVTTLAAQSLLRRFEAEWRQGGLPPKDRFRGIGLKLAGVAMALGFVSISITEDVGTAIRVLGPFAAVVLVILLWRLRR